MFTKNLNLRSRLLLAFGAVLLLTFVLALLSVWQLHSIKGNADELSSNWLPSVAATTEIKAALEAVRVDDIQLLTTHSDAERAQHLAARSRDMDLLDKAIATYLPLISSDEERQLAERMQEEARTFHLQSDEMLRLIQAGRLDDAEGYNTSHMLEQGAKFREATQQLVKLNRDGATAEIAHAEQVYRQSLISVGVATALSIGIGLALAWSIAADMRRRVGQAATAAERFAAGDLTHQFELSGGDEVTQMLQAMSAMRGQLSGLVHGVRQNAESVATASAEISQGNADLSSRTEQQASSLQQTAASMEEINSAAQNNADNAAQACQLAQQASGVADRGSSVVGDMVQTMRQIEQASRQVEDIISVIDGIAFQTNILALNAAVEAARAGEQGRGFAVVASEVRSLAQRSAEAARQVKQLIASSVERVASGTTLVDQAGNTMLEVKAAVQRVNDIVGEIAAGSREQMLGVGQVSEAVAQMDQATQQNAALVEESAAAAESLRQQADALVQAVTVFRVKAGDMADAAPAPRSSPMASRHAQSPVRRPAPHKLVASSPSTGDGQWTNF
ncbi:methyl-accepting chemotaxis protein [Roseateles sp.]|uniref:methyl-accepting chemotaxis protein n=1 Tax=Roseateles sp. TaxID=1971397 RepID=UPI0039E7A40C